MIVTTNMGLFKWDQIGDYFSHEQLAANFAALDEHDHTAGKGKPIPYGGLAEQSVGPENLREGVGDTTVGAYRTLRSAASSVALGESGFQLFSENGTMFKANNSYTNAAGIYLSSADYAAAGYTPKLRLRLQSTTGETAPGSVSFTFGLYPLTISTGDFSPGTVVSGSTIVLSGLARNTLTSSVTSDFTFPAEGFYGVGVTISSGTAAAVGFYYSLQIHYV